MENMLCFSYIIAFSYGPSVGVLELNNLKTLGYTFSQNSVLLIKNVIFFQFGVGIKLRPCSPCRLCNYRIFKQSSNTISLHNITRAFMLNLLGTLTCLIC